MVTVFRAKRAGYAHLIEKYALKAPRLLHASWVDEVSSRRSVQVGMTAEETFPLSYDPGESDGDHLLFARKYDGVDLVALSRLFRRLDPGELETYILAQPTSKYVRQIFYLFELLTGERLALDDLTRGNYIPVLEPDEYLVAEGRRIVRHRIIDNLWIGDIADGALARALDQETRIGAVLDIVADRAGGGTCALALAIIRPELWPALAIFLMQFMLLDGAMSLSFLRWPVKGPNDFHLIDRTVFRWNWSKPAKAINTAGVILAAAAGQPVLAVVIALAQVVVKVISARRLLTLTR